MLQQDCNEGIKSAHVSLSSEDEEEEQQASRVLRALNLMANQLASASTLAEVTTTTVEAAKKITNCKKVRLVYADSRGQIPSQSCGLSSPQLEKSAETSKKKSDKNFIWKQPIMSKGQTLLAVLEIHQDHAIPTKKKSELLALALLSEAAINKVRLIQDLQKQKFTLQQTLNELQKSNLIRDEFLASVSHELRTPLNAVLGWCQMLRSGSITSNQEDQALEIIERNALAQAHIVEDLLDASKIIAGKFRLKLTYFDLIPVLRETEAALQTAISSKHIRIRYPELPAQLFVTADVSRLQQAIWNLFSNAVKYTPEHGTVTIRVSTQASFFEIIVADSGVGIAPDFLPHLFDRFSQQDNTSTRAQGGLGLGLAIVKQIAELHGGSVSASSAGRDQGSSFSLKLPLLDSKEAPAKNIVSARKKPSSPFFETKAKARGASLKGQKILIVDDHPDSRNLMRVLTESQGAEVRCAESARAGIKILQSWSPNLIVSDIAMPEEDGYAFIHQVRSSPQKEISQVPAVAVTAYARQEDRSRALQSGFQEHISKPIQPPSFLELISKLSKRKGVVISS